MHLNHATAMANYQHYPPPNIQHANQQQTTITGIQQNPFTLHQLTAVQAIQHPTHQAMLHPQHPLVHLLDISSTTTTPNPTPTSPSHIEVAIEEEPVPDDPRKKKQCHVCKNKFRQLTTLRNHMKIHTDERPYKCKHCDKTFRQISTLTNHVKIHTGEKPFTCNICAKDFRQQSTLINHIKTHKGEWNGTTVVPYCFRNKCAIFSTLLLHKSLGPNFTVFESQIQFFALTPSRYYLSESKQVHIYLRTQQTKHFEFVTKSVRNVSKFFRCWYWNRFEFV